jgi:predicted ATPase
MACCEELDSIYDPGIHRDERFAAYFDPGPTVLGLMGETLWFLGYPDQALARCEEAVTLARDLKSPATLINMQMYLAFLFVWRRDLRSTIQTFEVVRAEAEEASVGWVYPVMDILGGWCTAHRGQVSEGIESIQRGLATWKAIGWGAWVSYGNALLADALRLAGRANEGMELWELAHRTVEPSEELQQEAEMLRIKGELYLALLEAEPENAEDAFRQAIEVARGQEARSHELRATVSLASHLRDTGRSREAREMLAEIYGWFTEGFDTADLKEAKAFLTELEAET